MDFLTDWLTNWLKELLIGGIMGNLEGLFDTVNTQVGEIDIIAKEDQTLVFVEVKYRKDDKKGYPAQAVDQRKQQKIRKSAMIYLKKNHLSFEQPIRFDVVEILGKKIRVIKHAF